MGVYDRRLVAFAASQLIPNSAGPVGRVVLLDVIMWYVYV